MICYKDMTFCSDKTCINENCSRHRSHTEGADLPVAWADFSPSCEFFDEDADADFEDGLLGRQA